MSELQKLSGIYRIKNLETGAMYIGQTSETFARRWSKHRCTLKAGRHENEHLQRSYNKHGKDAFEYKILEVIPQGDMADKEFSDYLNEREIILIAEHDAFENGYNFTEGGCGRMGYTFTMSEEQKTKLSEAHMGKKHSTEARAKMSRARTGKTFSAEHKAKLSAALAGNTRTLGHKHTPEHKAKISAAKMGKSTALKGKPWSAARRAKGNPKRSAETRAKMSAAQKGKPWTPAQRAAYEARKERL